MAKLTCRSVAGGPCDKPNLPSVAGAPPSPPRSWEVNSRSLAPHLEGIWLG
jgi:hypothetical protein